MREGRVQAKQRSLGRWAGESPGMAAGEGWGGLLPVDPLGLAGVEYARVDAYLLPLLGVSGGQYASRCGCPLAWDGTVQRRPVALGASGLASARQFCGGGWLFLLEGAAGLWAGEAVCVP